MEHDAMPAALAWLDAQIELAEPARAILQGNSGSHDCRSRHAARIAIEPAHRAAINDEGMDCNGQIAPSRIRCRSNGLGSPDRGPRLLRLGCCLRLSNSMCIARAVAGITPNRILDCGRRAPLARPRVPRLVGNAIPQRSISRASWSRVMRPPSSARA
jgi:hypothetical protein